jgi:hypothetical protein
VTPLRPRDLASRSCGLAAVGLAVSVSLDELAIGLGIGRLSLALAPVLGLIVVGLRERRSRSPVACSSAWRPRSWSCVCSVALPECGQYRAAAARTPEPW